MARHAPSRRFTAVILAYAVALQAFLSAWMVLPQAAAADSLAVICAGHVSDGPAKPGHAFDGLCCVAGGCCATTAAIARGDFAVVATPASHRVAHTAVASVAPSFWPSERPRSSRAPPLRS